MAYGSNNTGMAVVLVGLMLAGSLAFFLISQAWTSLNPDPAEESHDYVVTGTISGVEYAGTGDSEYKAESDNVYTYQFTYEASSGYDTQKGRFGLICDRDGTPISELYTYVGESDVGVTPVTVWEWSEKGYHYRIWMADKCKVMKYTVLGDGMEIRGDIIQEGARIRPSGQPILLFYPS